MIDDKQTCDVCDEEFNEERPHHEHESKKDAPKVPAQEPTVCAIITPNKDNPS